MLYRLLPGMLLAVLVATASGCVTSEGEFDGVEGIGQPGPDTGTPQKDSGAEDTAQPDADASTEAPPDTNTPDSLDAPAEEAPLSCDPTALCPDLESIGSVSGDTDSPSITANGTRSKWLKVRVTEDDSGLTAVALSATLTLDSPAGSNFDLYVYVANTAQQTDIECTKLTKASTNASGADVVSIGWPDKQGVGGLEDGRNVTVEIRFAGGTCPDTAPWSLLVEGNK